MPTVGFMVNQPNVQLLPPCVGKRKIGSVIKINEIAGKVGFKLSRSLSQPKYEFKHTNNKTNLMNSRGYYMTSSKDFNLKTSHALSSKILWRNYLNNRKEK